MRISRQLKVSPVLSDKAQSIKAALKKPAAARILLSSIFALLSSLLGGCGFHLGKLGGDW